MALLKGLTVAAVVLAACGFGPAAAEDLQMWERSGGNAPMVDALVAAWNEQNPDRKIVLTYIPHTEMVPKLAQAIASGDVPDLMGLDLIYGPQFESAGQLEDITELFQGRSDDQDRQPRAHAGLDLRRPALRGAALRRRLGAVLEQGPVRQGRARPREAADQPAGDARLRREDHRHRGRRLRLLPGRQLRRLQHLHLRPADLGLGRHHRAEGCRRRGAEGRQRCRRCWNGRG